MPWLDEHPERILALLQRLKDDPATLVRRVAPWRVSRTARARRARVAQRAVKRGDKGALRLLGYGGKARVSLEDVRFEPRRVAIGGRVSVRFALCSRSRQAQELLVGLAVHFVKARGVGAPKVFKLERVSLAPRAAVELATTVSLAVHTTRVPRPGRHRVDVLVNGAVLPAGSFVVVERGRGRRG